MEEWITVPKPADAAARWHVHQRRKGAAKKPYINHLLEVASLVAAATHGKDPNLVIAALLHDAFGTDLADLVMEVTDDNTLPKELRKKMQIATAHQKMRRAKIRKLADGTGNLRTLVTSPTADWSVRRKIEYIAFARKVAAGLDGANEYLEKRRNEAVRAAEQSLLPSL